MLNCRGSLYAYAYTWDDNACPNDVGFTWRYWSGNMWVSASDGLKIKRSSEDSKLQQQAHI